jgi:O-antigen ligase
VTVQIIFRRFTEFTKISLFLVLFLWFSFVPYFWGEKIRFFFLALIGVFLFIPCLIDKKHAGLIFGREEVPFWVFFLTMAGGLITASDHATAWYYFNSYIVPIPFFYFLAKTAFEKKHATVIARVFCFAAVLVCIFGIMEFISRRNFIYEYFMDNIYYLSFRGRRMISTQIHPSALGTYLIAIFPLSLVFFLKRNRLARGLSFACAGFILVGIILTFTRGALLGFFASIFIIAIVFAGKKAMRFILIALISLAVLIGICSVLDYCGFYAFSRFSVRGLSLEYLYSGKIDRFLATLKVVRDHPFFGLGLGNFRVKFDYYLPHLANSCGYDSKVPDCMYLAFLSETGIVGFGGFILFITFFLKRILAAYRNENDRRQRVLTISFLAGFAGFLCAFFTYDGLFWLAPSFFFWAFAGILSSRGVAQH